MPILTIHSVGHELFLVILLDGPQKTSVLNSDDNKTEKKNTTRWDFQWTGMLNYQTEQIPWGKPHLTRRQIKKKKGDLVQVETDRKMYCPVEKQYVSISSQEFSCSAHICKKPVGVSSWQVVIKKKISKRGETFSLSSLNISSLSLTSTILHGVLNIKDWCTETKNQDSFGQKQNFYYEISFFFIPLHK